ncbi:hypothetical protein GCM10012288_24190 [Malaciobacter pacificus]|uniref:Uncharacterized protein n=1 Tax=Malaciobacter pacificus TaxID=1080223 RepID=A0A5C2H965_9BACT|nr:hypothetical protein [Malaciobacter pacificus]QEP35363.1 hypothetical protein APAC_2303 [Malaciobacter pacificus]GGD49262.1 hypothetical protein GCM10012288_24190 [Malaciobacter pacificus]
MRLISGILLLLFILSGCSKYNDPQIAARISELESKVSLDEFEKEELKDLKQQGSSNPSTVINSCKI